MWAEISHHLRIELKFSKFAYRKRTAFCRPTFPSFSKEAFKKTNPFEHPACFFEPFATKPCYCTGSFASAVIVSGQGSKWRMTDTATRWRLSMSKAVNICALWKLIEPNKRANTMGAPYEGKGGVLSVVLMIIRRGNRPMDRKIQLPTEIIKLSRLKKGTLQIYMTFCRKKPQVLARVIPYFLLNKTPSLNKTQFWGDWKK